MTGPSGTYTPFDARANLDGSMNIYADGAALPGGQGLSAEAVLRVLSRFARENGMIVLTTAQLNGNVTRDLIDGSGEAVPYYEPVATAAEDTGEAAGPDEDVLLAALKTRGATGYQEPEYAPAAPKRKVVLELSAAESMPDFDVEGDIRKALSARRSAPATPRSLLIGGGAVVAAAAAGIAFYLLSGSVFVG